MLVTSVPTTYCARSKQQQKMPGFDDGLKLVMIFRMWPKLATLMNLLSAINNEEPNIIAKTWSIRKCHPVCCFILSQAAPSNVS